MRKHIHDDSDVSRLGHTDMHGERWRVYGNNAQMIDTSEGGQLSAAIDDDGVNTCKRTAGSVGATRADDVVCESGKLSGASDGAAASRRSAERRAGHARNGGYDIEGPAHIGGRVT